MISVVRLATCGEKPELTDDDAVLAQALAARGVRVDAIPWDQIPPPVPTLGAGETSAVCIRSTWDYHRRWTEFRRWVEAFARAPGRLWNPPATVLWNADKRYLETLEAAGVRLPFTRWVEPGDRPDCERFFREAGTRRAVLKPRVSATAYSTYLLERDQRLDDAAWAPLESVGSLLQAFVPEIADGEASLMFVDGTFTHAVRKRPTEGEFRVQRDFGGRIESLAPSAALREFAERVLASTPHPWLYARVDVVEAAEGPVLMELELIEPDLFLARRPAAAERLADGLIHRGSRAA
jgi:glutathione synthase/RimK-type ligase-like ATP-grasp enzyme